MGKKIIIEKVVINITKANDDILIEINQGKMPYHELLGILEMVKDDICLKRLDEIEKNKQEIKK